MQDATVPIRQQAKGNRFHQIPQVLNVLSCHDRSPNFDDEFFDISKKRPSESNKTGRQSFRRTESWRGKPVPQWCQKTPDPPVY
jgi:hypothetical protein